MRLMTLSLAPNSRHIVWQRIKAEPRYPLPALACSILPLCGSHLVRIRLCIIKCNLFSASSQRAGKCREEIAGPFIRWQCPPGECHEIRRDFCSEGWHKTIESLPVLSDTFQREMRDASPGLAWAGAAWLAYLEQCRMTRTRVSILHGSRQPAISGAGTGLINLFGHRRHRCS